MGLSDEDEKAIGARPAGRGVLGLLIPTDPKSLRLDNLGSHPTATDSLPATRRSEVAFASASTSESGSAPRSTAISTLTDKMGADTFSDEDEALAERCAWPLASLSRALRLHGPRAHVQRAR